jgi:hypothetical protein
MLQGISGSLPAVHQASPTPKNFEASNTARNDTCYSGVPGQERLNYTLAKPRISRSVTIELETERMP